MNNKTILIITILFTFLLVSCLEQTSESKDRDIVQEQQLHYQKVLPLPYYDYSIPRDIMIQIYNIVTQEARSTYTIIESITGVTKFYGPSVGYGIPVDTSLTNPLQPAWDRYYNSGEVVEQAEPNGLFSSKNTDGTWVLFVDNNGDITPVYTEHKVTTFPYAVKKDSDGSWVRADDKKATMSLKLKNN